MRRYSLAVRRLVLALTCTVLASLAVVASAQAIVVNDDGTEAGVALVPNARQVGSTTTGYLNGAGISRVTSSGTCQDPAASTEPDILSAGSWPLSVAPYSAQPICWQGGPVMHANETFTLEWEGQSPKTTGRPTKTYVQNFLRDVADSSGQLVNPYSDTTQYGTTQASRTARRIARSSAEGASTTVTARRASSAASADRGRAIRFPARATVPLPETTSMAESLAVGRCRLPITCA